MADKGEWLKWMCGKEGGERKRKEKCEEKYDSLTSWSYLQSRFGYSKYE
jgi:hypothetical protein